MLWMQGTCLSLWRNIRRICWLFFGGRRFYFRNSSVYRRLGFSRRLLGNQRGRRSMLMWIARRLWRRSGCRFNVVFGSSRRNDIEHHAIFAVHVTSNSLPNVVSGDVEILVQLGIEEMRI